jgi:hypothetical protein
MRRRKHEFEGGSTVIEIAGVLDRASVEVCVETALDEAHLRGEMHAFAEIYHLDLRYSVHESPPRYPKHISIWDADRPITLHDLTIATNTLYGGKLTQKPLAAYPTPQDRRTGA